MNYKNILFLAIFGLFTSFSVKGGQDLIKSSQSKPCLKLMEQVKASSKYQPKYNNFFGRALYATLKDIRPLDLGPRTVNRTHIFAQALLGFSNKPNEMNAQQDSLDNLRFNANSKKSFGIYNKGNTCYLNSMLQLLTSLHYLKDVFTPYKERFERSNLPGVNRFQQYLNSISNLDSSKLDPSSSLMDSLANASFVEPGRQGDTMESNSWILANLCEAAPELKDKFAVNIQTITYCNSDKCKNKAFKTEDNNQHGLCIPIQPSLEEGINTLCQRISTAPDATCPTCNVNGKVYQKSEIKKLPENLFVMLMRNENGIKNNMPVKYPLNLQLDQKTYTAVAFAMQGGSATGGHWVAGDFIRKKLFNDSVALDITDKEIKETAATGRVAFRGYSHFDIAGLLYVQTKK